MWYLSHSIGGSAASDILSPFLASICLPRCSRAQLCQLYSRPIQVKRTYPQATEQRNIQGDLNSLVRYSTCFLYAAALLLRNLQVTPEIPITISGPFLSVGPGSVPDPH